MTTPVDWKVIIPELRDLESIRFTQRVIEYQREWLDSQAAQLEEINRMLEEQIKKLG